MTIQNPALFLTGESHTAEDVRRWMSAMVSDRPGIVGEGDFLTAENGTPNMSVDVAAGRAYVLGDESSYHGVYFLESRSTENISITAADATNPRKDLIVLKVEDADYSGATSAGSLVVVTGTAAASPVEPTVPSNALVIALVDVAALASSIVDANITDRRLSKGTYTGNVGGYANALGGVRPVTVSTRPASPRVGDPIFETDSGKTYIWNGSAWTEVAYTSAVEESVPAGTVASWIFSGSAPTGWAFLDGSTEVGADGTMPDLWAVAPAGWKSGSDLTFPDLSGKTLIGYDAAQTEFNTLELTGGAKTVTLTTSTLPAHTHTGPSHTHTRPSHTHTTDLNHNHGAVTSSSAGGHTPAVSGGYDFWAFNNPSASYFGAIQVASGSSYYMGAHGGASDQSFPGSFTAVADHTHSVNLPALGTTNEVSTSSGTGATGSSGTGATGSAGSGAAFAILPPYFVLRFIIKT